MEVGKYFEDKEREREGERERVKERRSIQGHE
jgi:hypothetical protein